MSPRIKAAAVLVVVAVLWVFVNGPVEGATLVVLSAQHGITVADLLSVVLLLVALYMVLSEYV